MARNNGFTYLETIIVVLIIGVLSSIGLNSISNLSSRRLIETETKEIVSFLDLARIKTSSQDQQCGGFTDTYTVAVSGSTMTLTPDGCSALSSYTFDSAISFPEGNFSVQYLPQSTGISGTTCIIVAHDNDTQCGKITIENSGLTSDDIVDEASCTCP